MEDKISKSEIKNSMPASQLEKQVGNENINNEVNNMTDEEYNHMMNVKAYKSSKGLWGCLHVNEKNEECKTCTKTCNNREPEPPLRGRCKICNEEKELRWMKDGIQACQSCCMKYTQFCREEYEFKKRNFVFLSKEDQTKLSKSYYEIPVYT